MRIAQVSPLLESVPPRGYGGTERVVYYLTEELVRLGHQVTLFASGDSHSSARLIPITHRSLRSDTQCHDRSVHYTLMLEKIRQMVHEFDVVHFHIDHRHFTISRALKLPQLTTLHGRLDYPELTPLFQEFHDMPLISISQAQRNPIKNVNWIGNIPHGLPTELYSFRNQPNDYLAFLGRISPEKRVDLAIQIAIQSGHKLKIAAKVDPAEIQYFKNDIEPLLNHPLIEFCGEIDGRDKEELIRSARALIFPIDWPEPFGLVMIEALACGTPVIAFNRGSVPEVIDDGVSGFIVDDVEGAVKAVHQIHTIRRKKCREIFEQRFSSQRMAKEYVTAYESIVDESSQIHDLRGTHLYSRKLPARRTRRPGAQAP